MIRTQTHLEERINAITHGFAVICCLFLSYVLLQKVIGSGNKIMVYGAALFSFGMLLVYLASTVYHSIRHPGFKRVANVVDHISIFIMIGGTYAPIILHYIPEETAVTFLSVQWLIIIAGAILKIFYTGKYEWLSVTLYLALGWMLLFIIKPLIATMPLEIFGWIFAGGLCYTIGVIFYLWNSRKHAHNIWHCFVMAGTFFHFLAIYQSLDVAVTF